MKKIDKRIKRGLNYSIKDGVAWSVNDGLGSSYVSPYMITALKASDAQIGLLTSVPSLVANISQLESPKLMARMSRKKLVTILVFLQAIMWIPILSIAFLVSSSILDILLAPFLVIIFYTLYLMFGGLAGPAWSSWMGDLVPDKERGRFFGRRNEIIGFAGLTSMLLAGFFLDIFKMGSLLFGFATLFFIAMVARLVSRHFLIKQYEPEFKEEEKYYFSFSQFVRQIWQRGDRANNFGRFTLYVTLMSFAVNLAAPFFAVYMLRSLKFSYTVFIIITVSSLLIRLLSMPWWGRFSDKYGRLRTLRIGGFLIPAIPILWMFSSNPAYLVLVEMFGGLVWAAFDLGSFNFIYDAVTRPKRGCCFAYFNVLNGLGIFIGATLGGLLATHPIIGLTPILFLFLISGVLRLLFSITMLPQLREVRKVQPSRPLWYFMGSFIRRRFHI